MLGANQPVGSIEKLEISQTREIERIYSVGSFAFEPYRMVPKAVRTKLTLNSVVLNPNGKNGGGDFLAKVGFNSWNLYYQQAPFIIRQDLINPVNTQDVIVLLFFDCWITVNPCTFDLSTPTTNLVRQQIEVECGRMMASDSTIYGNSTTSKIVRRNMKFS